jgi:Putative adhesin
MPAFDTPEPISVAIDLVVGDARITASDREDTVVEIRPSDGSHEPDARAAEQTRVEYTAGTLLVKAPKQRALGLFGKVGSIDVTIELPAGSRVQGDAAVAAFRCVGRLGECRVKTATGDIQFDHTGPLDLNTGAGAIAVDRVVGHAEISTGAGRVRLREIDGTAVIKNSNGDSWVGEIAGDLRVNAANGDISVDHADAGITARTANGDVRIGEVTRGSASLKTGFGEIEIGIHAGTAAQLDVYTQFGRVHNHLDTADSPEPSDEIVEVRARTTYGDIVIRRS